MLDAAVDGTFKGLYIQGEDILQSDPDTKHVAAGLAAMDCVIVHDLFLNETANYAHVFLPGSTFLEKDGTFTNAERRIKRVRKVMEPQPGYADWEVTQALANAMGCGWTYTHPRRSWTRSPDLTPSLCRRQPTRRLTGGLAAVALQRCGPDGTPIMHVDGFVRGKGKFVVTEYVPTDERPAALPAAAHHRAHPVAIQCRRADAAHRKCRLARGGPAGNPPARCRESRHASDGDWVRLASRAGETTLRAQVTDRVSPGVVYTTFHHPDTQANVVTTDYSDWATNCPEYKVTAVQVSPSNGPSEWQAAAARKGRFPCLPCAYGPLL
jgi:formate dehydrogenase major subunit